MATPSPPSSPTPAESKAQVKRQINRESGTLSPSSSPTPAESKAQVKRQINRKSGTTRQRTGCLTCRQRRKKCDETYPICGHCTRLNLVCNREAPQHITIEKGAVPSPTTPTLSTSSWALTIPRAPDPIDICTFTDSPQGTNQRFLLQYYTNILSNLLTTNHENNSFLSVFLPMAVESPALLSAILAWSSIHLSCYNKSHELTAINHQSSAIIALASSLRSKSPDELDTTLAACLVLCATDIAFGDTDRWYNHMKGARDIIVTARLSDSAGRVFTGPECFMQTKDGQWLLRNFAYHDVLASVTLARPPLIRGAYWMREDEHTVDAYVGIGGKLLALTSEIACLMEDENGAEQKTEIDIIKQSLFLESQLLDWSPYPHPHAHDLLIELAESYRSTGLIYLYRRVRKRFPEGIDVIQDKIRIQVQETIRHVERIPPESLPGCGILFPLFMAGGDATEEVHMHAIQLRLQLLEQHRAFGNIKRARDVLDELWRLRSVGMKGHDGRPVDWLDVLQRKNWKLMLA